MEESENGHVGIRASALIMVTELIAQLKCIYTTEHGLGNKQEELEAIRQQGNCDIADIMETWWDDFHNGDAAMDGCKSFRTDRQERRAGSVALNVRSIMII